MSLQRRLALLQAAERCNAFIVEDDYDGDFYFGSQPLPTLKSIDTNDRVIYVGTFSKTLFPSLRLGFLLAPAALVGTIRTIFSSFLSGVPTWPQAVVADFIDEGFFATHIRTMRNLYRERHAVLHGHAGLVADRLDIEEASAGFHTVGYLRGDLGESDYVANAAKAGVTLSPIGRYCLAPIERQGVVIGYGSCPPPEIEQALARLAEDA